MRKRGGFTMVELIIVIIIIGLLITLALPQYRKMIERGQVARALAFLDMVKKAEAIYYASSPNNQYTGDWALLDNEVEGLMAARDALTPAANPAWNRNPDLAGDANGWSLTLARNGGYCPNLTIMMNQTGNKTVVPGDARCDNLVQ